MHYDRLLGYTPPEEDEDDLNEKEESCASVHGTRLWAIISLILASVGVILVLVPVVGIFFGAAAIAFSVISRIKNGYFYGTAVVGLIIGVIALACSGFFIIYNAMNEAGLVQNIFTELIK